MHPNTRIFVDTSGWMRLLDITDPLHAEANQVFQQAATQQRELISTNYIFGELIPLLTVRRNIQTRQQALQQVKVLKRYSTLRIIHIDERLDNLAWALLEHYSDKLWSLVDAASFVIMREMGMLEAITTDHHFEQAGFVRLLSA